MLRKLLTVSLLTLLPSAAARADLEDYVKRPEPKFAWKLNQKIESPDGVIYDLEMTSQVWQGIPWRHQLQVYQPKGVGPSATMLLWNTGGKSSPGNVAFAMDIARKARVPVAFLYGIPNQPLFDGKKEDALIAETFVRYLETHDGSWPLLFPMVKSVVKAMDALQAFAEQEWKQPVKQFVISGASKRGWTTWLTGAVRPARQGHRAVRDRHAQHGRSDGVREEVVWHLQRDGARLHRPQTGADPRHGRRPQALEDGRPVLLPRQADDAEAARQRQQRPVLDRGRAQPLLGRPQGRQVRHLRPERRAQPTRTGRQPDARSTPCPPSSAIRRPTDRCRR